MVSVTGLNWSGVKPKHDYYNRTLMLIKSEIIMVGLVYGLKYSTHQLRPDSSDYLSLPSGHTAQAFLSAAILDKEFRDRSIFYSIAGYATASAVGVLRILNNRHWTPDVLIGAAVGILSVNMVYMTHRYRMLPKQFRGAYIYPFSSRNTYGMGLMCTF
jgi:membrane-associated phospholipid phosphatase